MNIDLDISYLTGKKKLYRVRKVEDECVWFGTKVFWYTAGMHFPKEINTSNSVYAKPGFYLEEIDPDSFVIQLDDEDQPKIFIANSADFDDIYTLGENCYDNIALAKEICIQFTERNMNGAIRKDMKHYDPESYMKAVKERSDYISRHYL